MTYPGIKSEASSVEWQLSFLKAFGLQQRPCPGGPGQALMCQYSLVGLGAPERTSGEARYNSIVTEELRYSYACDVNRARDDSNLTVRRKIWNQFQYSSPI